MSVWHSTRAVGLALAILLARVGSADEPTLVEAFREYQASLARGDYPAATSSAEAALELGKAQLGADHPKVAVLLINLADLYARDRSTQRRAAELYVDAIAIMEGGDDVQRTQLSGAIASSRACGR